MDDTKPATTGDAPVLDVSEFTIEDAQALHDQRRREANNDPDKHDVIGCWCCCLDCDFDFETVMANTLRIKQFSTKAWDASAPD